MTRNEDMDGPVVMEQVYDAAVDTVWRALSNPQAMRQWYFPQLKTFEPVAGSDFEFTDDGSQYKKEWRVTEFVTGSKLAHSWNYKGYPGSSEVTFELVPEGEKTRLKLTHTGIGSFPKDPHFARHRFEDGWQQILGRNLREYLAR
jgi:uncharacterized protein YndB with AHSA1/START domain